MTCPWYRFQPLGVNFIAAGYAFSKSAFADAGKSIVDHLERLALGIALMEEKFLCIGTGGTIGNVHFLAIPFDAEHKAGAMVLANFLLSPEAQARKQDPRVWGSSTVLALDKLPSADRSLFAALELGIATPRPEELGIILPEPHPTWMKRIEQEWLRRYTTR